MTTSLAALKELPGILNGEESLCLSPQGPFAPGMITEVSGAPGAGKTEAVLRFLARNPSVHVAWIESELTIYPCAFPRHGVGLERVLFIEASPTSPRSPLWITNQALKSQAFEVVVLCASCMPCIKEEIDEMDLRRMQLLARKSRTALILLREEPTFGRNWPIAVQLRVSRDPKTQLPAFEILRGRGCS